MTSKLTEELRLALAQTSGEPLQLEDPVTHARYVLVPLDVYDRLRRAMDYDATDPDPRDFYPAFTEAVKNELDAPGMERYDEDLLPRETVVSVRRGDVVLLQAPFASRTGAKLRPMLVVQNDSNNSRMANTILVFITTNMARASEPTKVLVDVQTPEGRQSGLKQNSVVSCENLLTVVQGDILRTLGQISGTLMARVDQALKVSLALP